MIDQLLKRVEALENRTPAPPPTTTAEPPTIPPIPAGNMKKVIIIIKNFSVFKNSKLRN